jgi:hypothetical protein
MVDGTAIPGLKAATTLAWNRALLIPSLWPVRLRLARS